MNVPSLPHRPLGARLCASAALMLVFLMFAQVGAGASPQAPPGPLTVPAGAVTDETPNISEQLDEFKHALVRLPLAALLATILALRPRRRGTPNRQPAVVQTQIILAVIGGLVMLVVGQSLARAFGIVGAAGLVRYRAKVDDPKDAGVMLSTLAIGLASGVGLWLLASFGTLFIMLVLWVVESFEPVATRRFLLRVKAKDPDKIKAKIEALLDGQKAKYEIRAVTPGELQYEVCWPLEQSTDGFSERIVAMDPAEGTEVELEQMKAKP